MIIERSLSISGHNMTDKTAVSILYAWFKENIDTFSAADAQTEFRDSGQGSGLVRIDTTTFMTELMVKDKKFNLELEVIDRDTDKSNFPHIGDCGSQDEFEKQINEHLEWFKKVHA